jgi:hypothetical protein
VVLIDAALIVLIAMLFAFCKSIAIKLVAAGFKVLTTTVSAVLFN